MAPRWRKMLRDFLGDRGRAALMLTAVSVGVFGVATIFSTYSILTHEVVRNYMATNPASATLDVGEVTAAVLDTARNFPGIAEAEARSVNVSRVRVGDDWLRLIVFVIDDFEKMRLNTFRRISGAWPPPPGTMLIEHTALQVLGKGEGGSVLVKTPNGEPKEVGISGLVHDATLAPAWQERAGYGYVTRETFAALGEPAALDELRIQLTGNPSSAGLVETAAQALAQKLLEQGHKVHQIRVPPPRTHPHQTQMTTVLFLFLVFAVLALILSTILIATVVAAMLTRQVREIGMMKAVGARSGQIAWMYLSMLLGLGVVSVGIGLPAGVATSRPFADMVANLLNLEIAGYAVSPWVYVVIVAAGVLAPVLVALPIVYRGSRLTVREAISDFGVDAEKSFGDSPFDVSLGALRGIGLPYVMALRNMFRRRGRLILALSLLAAGGGMFITALNVGEGWKAFTGRIFSERFYDVQFNFNRPVPAEKLDGIFATLPSIRQVEHLGFSPAAVARQGRIDVARTYPDKAHGSMSLFGIEPGSAMIRFPLLSGRWLRDGDGDVVVLNQSSYAKAGKPKVGDDVLLSLDGRHKSWRLVGVVEEVGAPGAAYTPRAAYDAAAGTSGLTQMVRISTTATAPEAREKVIRRIDQALLDAGVSVRFGIPLALLHTAMGDHVIVLINMLIAAAVLLAVIGILGLTSTTSMNVIERTRELGIMRATGATPGLVLKVIVTEGVSIGLVSWVLAVLLSLPLSYVIGAIVGNMSFRTPLALTVSPLAVGVWLFLVVVMAALATTVPARRASKLAVREALAYE